MQARLDKIVNALHGCLIGTPQPIDYAADKEVFHIYPFCGGAVSIISYLDIFVNMILEHSFVKLSPRFLSTLPYRLSSGARMRTVLAVDGHPPFRSTV